MGPTIALRNIVGKAQDAFVEAVVPLHRHFNGNAIIALKIEVEHRVDGRFVDVKVFDECAEAAFILEQFLLARTLIGQMDTHARVQEGQLPQALGQNIPTEADAGEGLGRGLEVDLRTCGVGIANLSQRLLWHAVAVRLLPYLACPANGQDTPSSCISTGMPRPLSLTVMDSSVCMVMVISVQ